jgi:transcriptional regulator with XRE-family HTH domain
MEHTPKNQSQIKGLNARQRARDDAPPTCTNEHDFGHLLKRYRRGRSMENVAQFAGLTKNHIWRYEHGKLPASQRRVDDLARALFLNETQTARLRHAWHCTRHQRESGDCRTCTYHLLVSDPAVLTAHLEEGQPSVSVRYR